MIELVVMDEMGDRIQYTIRNPLRRLFEGDLSDSKVYTISNFSLSLNDQKYKPTTHSHRIYFKRETQFRIVHEPGFIDHSFHFNGTYVTYGTVVAIDYKSGWWYKSCKHCFHALKESENSFHCVTCDTFPNSHVPRFASIEIIGDDNTDSFSTPKRGLIEATSCTKSLIDVYPDFENQSSTKSRKITVEEVHNVVKLHEE
ncbi:hypothetical protein Ahy_B03g066097 [Arachis hypogaea]|uniref:Replication protein A 70 kDa DNA-binding subunit B/D first OB fold domain-containing protein n=1 Tax=Arachis hypogaea TaxID=3818 RepID=A0A445A350_ARAHY|nr:hypothetical protein Ahy_B03g066097 [Arachis hypogaea]